MSILEKSILLIIFYSGIFIHGKLQKKWKVRELLVYGGLLTISLFLSFDYLHPVNLLNLYDLVHAVLGPPAKKIVAFLKIQP